MKIIITSRYIIKLTKNSNIANLNKQLVNYDIGSNNKNMELVLLMHLIRVMPLSEVDSRMNALEFN